MKLLSSSRQMYVLVFSLCLTWCFEIYGNERPLDEVLAQRITRHLKRDSAQLRRDLMRIQKVFDERSPFVAIRPDTPLSASHRRALKRHLPRFQKHLQQVRSAVRDYHQRPRAHPERPSPALIKLKKEIWGLLDQRRGALFLRDSGSFCLAPSWRHLVADAYRELGLKDEENRQRAYADTCRETTISSKVQSGGPDPSRTLSP